MGCRSVVYLVLLVTLLALLRAESADARRAMIYVRHPVHARRDATARELRLQRVLATGHLIARAETPHATLLHIETNITGSSGERRLREFDEDTDDEIFVSWRGDERVVTIPIEDKEAVLLLLQRRRDAVGTSDQQVMDDSASTEQILTSDTAVGTPAPGSADEATWQSTATSLWNLDVLDVRDLTQNHIFDPNFARFNGSGVKIVSVDTGVYNHPDLVGRVSAKWTAYGSNFDDDSGHGTHTMGTAAGTTYGIARLATIDAYKALDSTGTGSLASLANAFTAVAADIAAPCVINLSLTFAGFDSVINAQLTDLKSTCSIVAAAGNSNVDSCANNIYPCSTNGVWCVGAIGSTGARASFSNFGSCVDVFGPGLSITSLGNTGSTTAIMSGTSMAVPHLVGIIALLLSAFPTLVNAQVVTIMNALFTSGILTSIGTNSPNKFLYAVLASTIASSSSSTTTTTSTVDSTSATTAAQSTSVTSTASTAAVTTTTTAASSTTVRAAAATTTGVASTSTTAAVTTTASASTLAVSTSTTRASTSTTRATSTAAVSTTLAATAASSSSSSSDATSSVRAVTRLVLLLLLLLQMLLANLLYGCVSP